MVNNDNYLMLNLNDEKSAILADVISNKSCKRIIAALAEKEMSESEIADKLNLQMNTVGYNIKKLVKSGLIEANKGFLWSVKGKRILKYRLSNRKIVISPKESIKGVLASVAVLALGGLGLFVLNGSSGGQVNEIASSFDSAGASASAGLAEKVAFVPQISPPVQVPGYEWAWFILGGLLVMLIFIILNRRKFE